MSRSLYKGPFYDNNILSKVNATSRKKTPIKIWSRNSTILPEFLGYKFEIHTGNRFVGLTVTEDMIGYKFGEFALTRKILLHKTKKGGKKK